MEVPVRDADRHRLRQVTGKQTVNKRNIYPRLWARAVCVQV